MSTHGHNTGSGRARLRFRLAFLAVMSAAMLALVASGALSQEIPLLQDETSTTTTTEAPSTTTSVVPTTEFLDPTTTTEPVTRTTAPPRTTTTPPSDVADDLGDDDVGDAEDLEELEETPTTEMESTTTSRADLLIPGDGTAGAESTTTTSIAATNVSSADEGISEETMLWIIVAGLVVVAILIGLWTVRFWRATRPPVVPGDDPGEPDDPTTVFSRT